MRINKQEKTFCSKVRKKVVSAICKYDLINDGDRIIIGVSGGKDSLILLDLLGEIKKSAQYNFDLLAVHIDVENVPYEIDHEYVKSLCDNHGIEYLHESMYVDFNHENFNKNKSKNNCFVCSWYRRKKLFNLAKERNYNKIALGHHMDDIVQTLLMNMIYNSSIKTMVPKMSLFNGDITIIRPLALLREEKLIEFLKIKKYILQKKNCPYEEQSTRTEMRDILKQLSLQHKNTVNNIYKSMTSINTEYLPKEIL